MIRLLSSWLRSKGTTVFLSLAFMALAIYYGVTFELQSKVDAELRHPQGVSAGVEQANAPPGPAARNAAPFYDAATALCRGDDIPREDNVVRTLDLHAAEVEARLRERSLVLNLLAEGYRCPDCTFRFETRQPDGEMQTPDYIAMGTLFQRCAMQTILDLRQGQTPDAIEVQTHLLCYLRRMHREESLVAEMVKIHCGAFALEALEAMAAKGERADYSALLRELDLVVADAQPALIRAMAAERGLSTHLVEHLDTAAALYSFEGDFRWYMLGGRPVHLLDELYMLSVYDRYDEGLKTGDVKLLTIEPGDIPRWCYMSRVLLPSMQRAFDRHQTYLSRLHGVRDRLATLNVH